MDTIIHQLVLLNTITVTPVNIFEGGIWLKHEEKKLREKNSNASSQVLNYTLLILPEGCEHEGLFIREVDAILI